MSAETERSEKNLAAIKRIDPLAESILARSTHATIYDYETTETKWVKTPFEGSLFVYRRIDRPFYSLIVVNRQSLQDFIEPITEKLKIKYVAPYIYFYKPDGTIKGLWFFRPEEGQSMFELLTNLIENPLEYQKQKPKTTLGQTRGANKGKIDIGTGSVAVSANSVNWQSIAAAQPTSVHRAESLTGKRLSAVENTKEAKNGSTSENDEISSKVLQMLATLGNGTANENAVTPASKSPSLLRAQNVNAKSVEELECDLTRPPPSIEQRKEAKKQPLPVKTEPNEVEPNGSQQTVKSVTVNSLLARPEKSAPEQANINRGANAKQVVNAKVPWSKVASDTSAAGSHTANTQMNAPKPKPVGLTKEQLQQAIEHLLKTDAEFLDKLHVAYTESLLARFQA